MPYIPKKRRKEMKRPVCEIHNAGELNNVLTLMILDYLPAEPRYQDYNEVMGVLTCMQLEFYRRLVAPYEDRKRIENGDLF